MLLINYVNQGLQRVPNIQVHSPISTSNDSDHSEKQRLLAIQNESRATRNLELLIMKPKLEEVEKRALVEVTLVSHRN